MFFKKKRRTAIQDSSILEARVYEKIRSILPIDLKDTPLRKDTRFSDLGIDSIQYINLLYSLDELIDVDIVEIAAGIDISQILQVGDIIEVLEKTYVRE